MSNVEEQERMNRETREEETRGKKKKPKNDWNRARISKERQMERINLEREDEKQ